MYEGDRSKDYAGRRDLDFLLHLATGRSGFTNLRRITVYLRSATPGDYEETATQQQVE